MVTAINTIGGTSAGGKSDLARLRNAVGAVTGSIFYGTLLKTMRESGLKGSFGHGGRGEEVFAAQLHGILAEEMGKATRGGIADSLYSTMEHQQLLISELRSTA